MRVNATIEALRACWPDPRRMREVAQGLPRPVDPVVAAWLDAHAWPWDVEHGAVSSVGPVREVNEDAWFASPPDGVYVVMDGMGGSMGGQWACAILLERLEATFGAPSSGEGCAVTRLRGALHRGDEAIRATGEQDRRYHGCAVTAAGLCLDAGRALWVGSDRVWRLRGGRLEQLTRDHTLAEELAAMGAAAPAGALDYRSVVTRVVGMGQASAAELGEEAPAEVAAGDVFLLSTDGLHRSLEAGALGRLLGQPGSAQERAERLVAAAVASPGCQDNVTALVVRVLPRAPAGGG